MTTYLLLVEGIFTVHCCTKRKKVLEKDYKVQVMREFPKESDVDVRKWHCGYKICINKGRK